MRAGYFVVGAIVGYVVWQQMRPHLLRQRRETQIKLDWNATSQKFTSKTRDRRLRAKKHDEVVWEIKDDPHEPLPGDAEVEIRFQNDRSPLDSRRPKGRQKANGEVTTHQPDVYTYTVWYVSPASEYCMEDPDLEILP